jgi:NDP-sugar pyrophosphorylase family protein
MQALILAGGAGTRLKPLTLNTPKPMIDVNGKPFLRYIIDELMRYNINDVILCIGYLPEKFKEYFGDGSDLGIKVRYSVEKEFLGTAGAIRLAENMLADDFLVMNGDTYLPIDYREVYHKFKSSGKTGLMVLYNNAEKIAEPNIALDSSGNVAAYYKREVLKRGEEVMSKGEEIKMDYKYIDAGAQIFKKSVLDLIPAGKFVSLEADVFPQMIKNKDMSAYISDKRFYDLGTQQRLDVIRSVFK